MRAAIKHSQIALSKLLSNNWRGARGVVKKVIRGFYRLLRNLDGLQTVNFEIIESLMHNSMPSGFTSSAHFSISKKPNVLKNDWVTLHTNINRMQIIIKFFQELQIKTCYASRLKWSIFGACWCVCRTYTKMLTILSTVQNRTIGKEMLKVGGSIPAVFIFHSKVKIEKIFQCRINKILLKILPRPYQYEIKIYPVLGKMLQLDLTFLSNL